MTPDDSRTILTGLGQRYDDALEQLDRLIQQTEAVLNSIRPLPAPSLLLIPAALMNP